MMVFLFYFFDYYLSKIVVIRFFMKRLIFTESQWCRLNEGRARKPQVNMDVELPKQGRMAAKITPKEFEEKMRAIWDKHIENTYGRFTPSNFVYRFCRQHLDCDEMKAVRDDLAKIQHDEENLDAIGKIESSNGLTYLKCDVGGDWEAPMLFFLYWDGNKFRAYIPTYGNAFNRSTKTAFGNNNEEDLKFLKSQNPDFSDEELSKFIHNVGYNVDACLKDFKARVTVKKSNVNENIGDVKKFRNGSKIRFTRANPTSMAKALVKWLDKNGIEYSDHTASTRSRYISFDKDDVDYDIRFANHTKAYGGLGEDLVVDPIYDRNSGRITVVNVDLGNDDYSEISSYQTIVSLINDVGKYNELVAHDAEPWKNVTMESFPTLYGYLTKDRTDQREAYMREMELRQQKTLYWQYVRSLKDECKSKFVSSNGYKLIDGKWRLENGKYANAENRRKAEEELNKFAEAEAMPFEQWLKELQNGGMNESKRNKRYILNESQFALLNEMMLFEASLEDIYSKYYSNIPQEEFNKIVFADPTSRPEKNKMGKYGKWLLSLYQRGKLKIGDLGEAKECLSTFSKYINRIEVKDINKYGSIRELYDAVRPFMSGGEATSKSDALRRQKHAEAEKVYEDELWEVIIPHTEKASCIYGKGTKWCTAAESSQNMFDYYNERGPLYININKKNGKKYQFHFETDSFMDEEDKEIERPIWKYIGLTKGLLDFYGSINPINKLMLLYDEIGPKFNGWRVIVNDQGYYNYVNDNGEFMFDSSLSLMRAANFSKGLGKIQNSDGLWNFVNVDGNILFKEWFQELDYSIRDNDSGWMPAIDAYNHACMANMNGEVKRLDKSISSIGDEASVYGIEVYWANLMEYPYRTFLSVSGDIINPSLKFTQYLWMRTNGTSKVLLLFGQDSLHVNILTPSFKYGLPQWMSYITDPYYSDYGYFSEVISLNGLHNIFKYSDWSLVSKDLWFRNLLLYDDYLTSIDNQLEVRQAIKTFGKGEPWFVGTDEQDSIYFIYGNGEVIPSEQIIQVANEAHALQGGPLIEQILTEASLEDIYAKYYSSISQEEFNKIVFADPTSRPEKNKMGKYGKWLLSLYQRGKLKVGDLNEAKACLEYFVKFINRIEVKDINKYGSIRELYDVVEPFMESPNQATSKSDALRREKEQDATKVYEDDMWEVIVPHTQEMACLYGKHTRWCTAAESSDNMFNYYHRQGELYININKQSGKKYQFHFESDSFMDEMDNPINSPIAETIKMTDGLLGYYKNNRSFTDYLRLLYTEVGDESEGFVKVFDENEGYSWVRLSDGKKLATAYYYEDVGDFHSGRAWVYVPHNEREAYGDEIEGEYDNYNFVNERGVLISDVWYEDVDDYHGKYTRVARDWKYNLIDVNGKPLFGWGQYVIFPTAVTGLWSITDPQRGVNFVNDDGQIVSPNMWFDQHDNGLGSDRNSYVWGIKYKYDDNNERYEEQYKVYPNGKIEKRVVEGRSPKRFHMTEEQCQKLILLSKENGKCRHFT